MPKFCMTCPPALSVRAGLGNGLPCPRLGVLGWCRAGQGRLLLHGYRAVRWTTPADGAAASISPLFSQTPLLAPPQPLPPSLALAGKAASAGVTTAAKVTVQVGAEALKAAAPVGKWALQQGVKLAVGAVAKGISSAASSGKKGGGGDKQKK